MVSPSVSNNHDQIFLIGNSLTWDAQPKFLDGYVQYRIQGGVSLNHLFSNPLAADGDLRKTVPWLNGLSHNQLDWVVVQPYTSESSLPEDLGAIAFWMEMQPDANFLIHTGWNTYTEHEINYQQANLTNQTLFSQAYYHDLYTLLNVINPQINLRSTKAVDLLDSILRDTKRKIAPFGGLSHLYRDTIHMSHNRRGYPQGNGRYLMHNLLKYALNQPLGGREDLISDTTTQNYLHQKIINQDYSLKTNPSNLSAINQIHYVNSLTKRSLNSSVGNYDLVIAAGNYTLDNLSEALILQGKNNFNGFGNHQENLLIGNTGNNLFRGNENNDILLGKNGQDTLLGNGDNDALHGGNNRDQLFGGTGQDILVGGKGDDLLNGGSGSDTLFGGNGNDTLEGNHNNDYLNGGANNDLLIGGLGNDTLIAFMGQDTLIGGNGHDYLQGSGQHDRIFGGNGNDTLDGEMSNDLLFGSEGNDLLMGRRGDDYLSGGSGKDFAYGGNGNDILLGFNAQDTLIGNRGADLLQGGNNSDILIGSQGSDTLIGGFGDDLLTGGFGADYFEFNALSEGIDTIADYSVLGDTIVIRRVGFGGLALGTLNSSRFTIGSSAKDKSDRFIYNQFTGALFFDRDGNGAIVQQQIANLSNNLALTYQDFLVL